MKSHATKFGFPDEKTLKRVLENLSDPNKGNGNVALPEEASAVGQAKYQLRQLIGEDLREHSLLQKELKVVYAGEELSPEALLTFKEDNNLAKFALAFT